MNLIAMAIPVFFILIGVELAVAHLRGEQVYRFSDSIADLSCGVVQQLGTFIRKGLLVGIYVAVYENLRIAEVPYTWWGWTLAFLAVDFAYYWFHRLSHEINFMWAAHVVHHQSEEYNLTVALRQSFIQGFFSMWFYFPLAVLGFPLLMFGLMVAVNTLYQFWIHTRLVDRLGWLEYIINTPSHHRVHHGQNPKYIDKNHAGTLIIWDMLFGTFQWEEEEPVYGVTEPVASWNVLWANTHVWADSWRRYKAASTLEEKLQVWFGKPGFTPSGFMPSGRPVKTEWIQHPKYDPVAQPAVVYYVAAQFVVVLVATVVFLAYAENLSWFAGWGLAAAIVLATASLGALLDGRRWAFGAEVVRAMVTVVGLVVAVATLSPAYGWPLIGLSVTVAGLWSLALAVIRPRTTRRRA